MLPSSPRSRLQPLTGLDCLLSALSMLKHAHQQTKATLRTDAGKRELARRTRALRLEWKATVKAAYRIARGKRPRLAAGEAATAGDGHRGVSVDNSGRDRQRSVMMDNSAPLVEAPFLRFLWSVHGVTAAAAVTAAAEEGVEPSELKYLGASLRRTMVGQVTRRVRGGEVRWRSVKRGHRLVYIGEFFFAGREDPLRWSEAGKRFGDP